MVRFTYILNWYFYQNNLAVKWLLYTTKSCNLLSFVGKVKNIRKRRSLLKRACLRTYINSPTPIFCAFASVASAMYDHLSQSCSFRLSRQICSLVPAFFCIVFVPVAFSRITYFACLLLRSWCCVSPLLDCTTHHGWDIRFSRFCFFARFFGSV